MKAQLLKSFISFLIINSSLVISSNAQIVYTDNTDTTLSCNLFQTLTTCTKQYLFDLNNDGINDFRFDVYARLINQFGCSGYGCLIKNRYSYLRITPLDTNNAAKTDNSNYPLDLNSGEVINSSGHWNSLPNQTLRSSGGYTSTIVSGNWDTTADAHLGLRIMIGNNFYYGWARLSVNVKTQIPYSATSSFKLKDYAFNSIPNQPILSGEPSCTTPTVTLSTNGPLSFCNGDSVVLTANTTAYKYQWKKDGVNIAGATKQTYVAKTAGVYKCKVTNSCGSKTSGGKTVTVPCRNSDETFSESLEQLSVYPNPAINSVTVKFPSDEAGEVQIVNLFGQIVFSEKLNSEQNANLPAGRQVDVSKFPAGMYVVRWNSGIINETKTFSVTK